MAMHYMNPKDASNPHKLPNIDVFMAVYGYCPECGSLVIEIAAPTTDTRKPCEDRECQDEEVSVALDHFGWFYTYGLPGCLPDSESFGPFKSEDEALKDARGGETTFGEDSDD